MPALSLALRSGSRLPPSCRPMRAGELLAFTASPKEHWRQIWSNNPQERLNKELRRRTDVVCECWVAVEEDRVSGSDARTTA